MVASSWCQFGSSGFTNVEKDTKSITVPIARAWAVYHFILIYCKPTPAVAEEIEVDLQVLKKDFMNVLC